MLAMGRASRIRLLKSVYTGSGPVGYVSGPRVHFSPSSQVCGVEPRLGLHTERGVC